MDSDADSVSESFLASSASCSDAAALSDAVDFTVESLAERDSERTLFRTSLSLLPVVSGPSAFSVPFVELSSVLVVSPPSLLSGATSLVLLSSFVVSATLPLPSDTDCAGSLLWLS